MAVKKSDGETVKRSNGDTGKRPASQTVKTSLQLDPLTVARLAGLVAITGEGHSAIVALAVENYLSRLGPDKRNAVQGIVIARLGAKGAEPAKVDEPAGGAGQGGAHVNRMEIISAIGRRATEPLDNAIEITYG
jgi:hypothetical protein